MRLHVSIISGIGTPCDREVAQMPFHGHLTRHMAQNHLKRQSPLSWVKDWGAERRPFVTGDTRGGFVFHLHKGANKVQAKSVGSMNFFLLKVQCSLPYIRVR